MIPAANVTVDDLLRRAAASIRASEAVDLWRASDARVNAQEMMASVLGKEVTSKVLDELVTPSQEARFSRLVARRVSGEPVAMIVGWTEFRGLKLKVMARTFIPRSSSELLAGEAIRRIRRRSDPVAVDVATGSGPVAMAVASEVRGATVLGLDISSRALALARSNSKRLGLSRIRFLKSDLLAAMPPALAGKVDVFTLHPPYVAKALVKTLPSEIRDFEPFESLTDHSEDGLGLAGRLVEESPAWLKPRGWVLIEVSSDLSRGVSSLLRGGGFGEVRSVRDSLGATRVVCGRFAGR